MRWQQACTQVVGWRLTVQVSDLLDIDMEYERLHFFAKEFKRQEKDLTMQEPGWFDLPDPQLRAKRFNLRSRYLMLFKSPRAQIVLNEKYRKGIEHDQVIHASFFLSSS
jgi:hypothetical protein